MFRAFCITLATLMIFAAPALRAQSTQPDGGDAPGATDSPEAAAVKTVAKEFMMAVGGEDLAEAKKLFAGTDEDFKLVTIIHNLSRADRNLKSAARAKWPEEMKNQLAGDTMDPTALAARIDRETVTIDGDTAKFTSGMMLKKSAGKWQVVDLIGEPMGKNMVSTMLASVVPLMEETATEIEQGKYGSFAEARESIATKMRTSRQGPGAPGRTPATQPAE